MFDSIRSVTSAASVRSATSRGKKARLSIRSRVGRRQKPWRAVHAVQGRTDRRLALDDLGLDAPRDLRGHGSARAVPPRIAPDAERTALVRRRRAGCARTDRRTERRARAAAKIWGPLRTGFSIDFASLQYVWARGRPHDRRKLRQHADPPLLRERGRRDRAVRLAAHRRARSDADHGLEESPATEIHRHDIPKRAREHVEHALLASQIEQLPDLTGYLKYASDSDLATRAVRRSRGLGGRPPRRCRYRYQRPRRSNAERPSAISRGAWP
jgi:hypothetical protein